MWRWGGARGGRGGRRTARVRVHEARPVRLEFGHSGGAQRARVAHAFHALDAHTGRPRRTQRRPREPVDELVRLQVLQIVQAHSTYELVSSSRILSSSTPVHLLSSLVQTTTMRTAKLMSRKLMSAVGSCSASPDTIFFHSLSTKNARIVRVFAVRA